MSVGCVYTFSEAARLLGCHHPLVGFLVTERGIPHGRAGRQKLLDDAGLDAVRAALLAYRQKARHSPSLPSRESCR
jgi:excisionase family DNA binding protein